MNPKNKNKEIIDEENLVYVETKRKGVSYINSIFYFIGWGTIVFLTLIFAIFTLRDFVNAVKDFNDDEGIKVNEFFAIILPFLELFLYVLVIIVSGVKSLRYYIVIRSHFRLLEKKKQKKIDEIILKLSNNEEITPKEKKLKEKYDKKIKKKEEKEKKKKEKKKEELEKTKKEIEEIQSKLEEEE